MFLILDLYQELTHHTTNSYTYFDLSGEYVGDTNANISRTNLAFLEVSISGSTLIHAAVFSSKQVGDM